jgi:hypothetical protein
MNANELADYLDNNIDAMLMSEQKYIDESATMLRQQQKDIVVLKNALAIMNLNAESILKEAQDK